MPLRTSDLFVSTTYKTEERFRNVTVKENLTVNGDINNSTISGLATDISNLEAEVLDLSNNKYDKTGGLITGNVDISGGDLTILQSNKLIFPEEKVRIGNNTGNTNQGVSCIAIGDSAGQTNQGQFPDGEGAIAIGTNAGNDNQHSYSIAIGYGAGELDQGTNGDGQAIAIGLDAGNSSQSEVAIAIGKQAGNTSQGAEAIAIGAEAGTTSQGNQSVAVGRFAGRENQGADAIAIGNGAGQQNQGINAIAIGQGAGQDGTQGIFSIAIGSSAGAEGNLGENAIAIGKDAGLGGSGDNCILIGKQAEGVIAADKSIVLNATGFSLSAGTSNAFFVKPIQGIAHGIGVGVMKYDPNSGEITYSTD